MKTGRARRRQQRARRRCTTNLLEHSPARGGVMALIICLGARPEGVAQLLISHRELSQIHLKQCGGFSLFLPHMQENNPQLCNTLLPAYSFTTRSSAAERSIASISLWRVTARSKSTSNPVPEAKTCATRL